MVNQYIYSIYNSDVPPNIFNWQTDVITNAHGRFGFTLYDINGNVLYQRLPANANVGDSESIKILSTIDSISFETNSPDGFMGFVEVRIAGEKQLFNCTNCHASSPSTELSYIYLDKATMNGDLDLPGAANCENTCTFQRGICNLPLT